MTPRAVFRTPSLGSVLTAAGADATTLESARAVLRTADAEALPWYVRAATGFGAWMAAAFLLAFLGAAGAFDSAGFNLVLGIGFLVAACPMAGVGNEFRRQLAVALGLTGQTLTIIGLFIAEVPASPLTLLVSIQAALMVFAHRDSAHRFLSAGAVLGGLLAFAADANLPMFGEGALVVAFGAVVLLGGLSTERTSAWMAAAVGPARFGLLAAALCVLAFSIGPELRTKYLTPLTGLGLTALLTVQMLRDTTALGASTGRRALILPVAALVGGLSLQAPGVPAALVVLGLAVRERDAVLLLFGVVFLCLFLSGFYYSLTLPLWHKAGLLLVSGVAALLVRAAFVRLVGPGAPVAAEETSR